MKITSINYSGKRKCKCGATWENKSCANEDNKKVEYLEKIVKGIHLKSKRIVCWFKSCDEIRVHSEERRYS